MIAIQLKNYIIKIKDNKILYKFINKEYLNLDFLK